MEIRRTGEAREIQKFETEIRRQTGRAISAGYHAGKGFRKTAKSFPKQLLSWELHRKKKTSSVPGMYGYS